MNALLLYNCVKVCINMVQIKSTVYSYLYLMIKLAIFLTLKDEYNHAYTFII